MGDDDVPLSPRPIHGPPRVSPGRFILQHLAPQEDAIEQIFPHNQDARLPADMSQFPPPVIIDMLYGCAALSQWGIPQTIKAIDLLAKPSFDIAKAARSPRPSIEAPRPKRAKKQAGRHCDQSERPITMDKAMDLISILWSRSCPQPQEEPPPTQDMCRDRVNAWLQTQ
jgi:hypothetical protein